MEKVTEKFRLEESRSGLACLWEAGGGYTNTGAAYIIAGHDGRPKKALYIRRRGHLANCEHALIAVDLGDYIIYSCHHRLDHSIRIYRIIEIQRMRFNDGNRWYAVAELLYTFDQDEWLPEYPRHLEDAIAAAMDKSTCFHCRSPHFVAFE